MITDTATILTEARKVKICKHIGCIQKHDSHGYCANHARQFRKYGHPLSKAEISEHMRLNRMKSSGFTGHKRSEAWKREQSEKCKGVTKNSGRTHFKKGYTPWNAGKKWVEFRGENHPRWRGGSGSERHQDMGKHEYKIWRNAVFRRDNYTCQICEQYGGTLHADHIKGWKEYPELRYEVTNGRTLCVPCHYYVTFKRKMPLGTKWCGFTLTRKRG